MGWNDVYAQSETVWGEKPDMLLMELAPQVTLGLVLDLGMGEGRNALPFAQMGYEVCGVDSSPAAVQKCIERAKASNLSIDAQVGDMRQIDIAPNTLTLVICAMSLQFMRYSESEALLQRIKVGLQPGGFIYLTVFSTEDPGLERFRQTGTPDEPNTYYIEQRETHVHFFEKEEILAPLEGLTLHHLAQMTFLDPGHPGALEPHYHGMFRYIGQKP